MYFENSLREITLVDSLNSASTVAMSILVSLVDSDCGVYHENDSFCTLFLNSSNVICFLFVLVFVLFS